MTPELDLLSALGQVDPPPAAVLDAAREALWSAVAPEMLAADPSAGEFADPAQSRRSPAPGADRRSAASGADQPRPFGQDPPADPGA
jgi:hypothetical protein